MARRAPTHLQAIGVFLNHRKRLFSEAGLRRFHISRAELPMEAGRVLLELPDKSETNGFKDSCCPLHRSIIISVYKGSLSAASGELMEKNSVLFDNCELTCGPLISSIVG